MPMPTSTRSSPDGSTTGYFQSTSLPGMGAGVRVLRNEGGQARELRSAALPESGGSVASRALGAESYEASRRARLEIRDGAFVKDARGQRKGG